MDNSFMSNENGLIPKYNVLKFNFSDEEKLILEELRENPVNKKLLDNTDLLIDGEYIQELTDYSRPWCGSSNQRYHFLTNKYNEEIFTKYKNKVEVNISKNGQIFMNGMGNFDEILQKIDLKVFK